MIILQTKSNEWFCTNSVKIANKIVGKNNENLLNLWEQAFQMPCDFFQIFKDGEKLERGIPMRGWEQDLPLSECLKGKVKWLAIKETSKPPVWYRDFLNTDWVQFRENERLRALHTLEKIENAKSSGDKNAETNAIIDFMLGY